ncbi:MAG: hypothetical protein RIQ68_1163 [Pseudomonadota bacterium]|jgi:hypothetical protein
MTQYETPETAPQAVSRLGLYLPTGLLLLLAIGWSGFWFFASNKADDAFSTWIASEKAGGRTWECAGKEIGGYPFRIELHCASIKFSTAQMKADLGAIHAATQIYSPKLLLADVSGPLQINSAGVQNVFSWTNMRVSLRFNGALERLSMNVADFKAGEAADSAFLSAKMVEFHLRTDTARPSEDKATDVVMNMNDLRAPGLDALVGNPDTTTINFSGTITQALGLRVGNWQSALENWRSQNGQIFLENGRLAKGLFSIEGKGTLGLDPAHRVQGDLMVGARGVGPIISRFVSGNAAQLAGALLERKDGSVVQLPLRMQDGRVSFGPLRTGPILAPLY